MRPGRPAAFPPRAEMRTAGPDRRLAQDLIRYAEICRQASSRRHSDALLIVTLSFFLMRIAPGGPFDKERVVPPEIEARLIHAYHLDEPLPMQFLRYLGGLAHGDFGPSLKYKDFSVTELIAGGFPVSLRLGGIAVLLALSPASPSAPSPPCARTPPPTTRPWGRP